METIVFLLKVLEQRFLDGSENIYQNMSQDTQHPFKESVLGPPRRKEAFDISVVMHQKATGPHTGRGTDCSGCAASWFSETPSMLRRKYLA
jgi:hypothetical protein